MSPANLHFEWRNPGALQQFQTAVSLHSHTLFSQETLSFIPRIGGRIPLLSRELRKLTDSYRRAHGRDLDFSNAWWTPPSTPQAAWNLERHQIESVFQKRPLVSITDHDSIDAPLLLQASHSSLHIPVSVEWTVPFGSTFFHLGVHNLPPDNARQTMRDFAELTARPTESRIAEMLAHLSSLPDVLLVWNHPLWDEESIGATQHQELGRRFANLYRPFLHALELNGMRPWLENRRVVDFAASLRLPVISGGDRHSTQPNLNLNLTNARTFHEFVAEIRAGSSVVFFRHPYREAHTLRVLDHAIDILRDHPSHGYGWRKWSDRVFYRRQDGSVHSLTAIWRNGTKPWLVQQGVAFLGLLSHSRVRSALRFAFPPGEEILP